MKLFISYAHTDTGRVNQLVETLRDAGHEPWFDNRLMPGQDWKEALLRAVADCDVFVYALTRKSVVSEWCQWEFARAVELKKPIIPVLMQTETRIPDAIANYQYVDFSKGLTSKALARLTAGLSNFTINIPSNQSLEAPTNPKGKPAQAESLTTLPVTITALSSKTDEPMLGRNSHLEHIISILRKQDRHQVVAIQGMGGIGKTVLARAVVEQSLRNRTFEHVIWKSASDFKSEAHDFQIEDILDTIAYQLNLSDTGKLSKSEKQAFIADRLKDGKVLIVLDGLDEISSDNTTATIDKLSHLVGKSKILLTSRFRIKPEASVVELQGLDMEGSLELIRNQMDKLGISREISLNDATLQEIAQLTRGNPLAIKLVVGQLVYYPVAKVLSELHDEAKVTNEVTNIFSGVWEMLSEDAQKLLITILQFAPDVGGTINALKVVSGFSSREIESAITELLRFSMLEVFDSSFNQEKRYYLHPLTRQFLLSSILHTEL